jgi:hypothetical protein
MNAKEGTKKETLLGLHTKREDDFGKWYSQVRSFFPTENMRSRWCVSVCVVGTAKICCDLLMCRLRGVDLNFNPTLNIPAV